MGTKRTKFAAIAVLVILAIGGLYIGFFRLSASDCTSVEKYDTATGTCNYDCTTDQDCADKAKKVDAELNGYFVGAGTKESKQASGRTAPVSPTSTDDTKLLTKDFTGTDTNGTVYTVTSKLILTPKPSNSDEQLWDLFSKVAGKDDIAKYVQSFEVFNDANNDSAASVWQSQTSGKWHVNVNAAYQDDKKDLIHTMVHEYGHIVSLNSTQVNGNVQGSCPNLSLSEGCANQGAYINAFYDKFWQKYGDNAPANEGQDQDEVQDFYQQHTTAFVTDYSATNYGEDWAESWTAFVTQAAPKGNQEKDQKIRSFYDYPALVNARERIRGQIAASL